MFRFGGHRVQSPPHVAQSPRRIRVLAASVDRAALGPSLLPNRSYPLIRIGAAEFAYTTADAYLRALGQAWAAGLTPDPLPSAMGRDLATAAHALWGVDTDLTAL